jgi:hypothetical protein
MKTLKLAMVATMVAFMMVSAANADGFRGKPNFSRKVVLTIEKAMESRGLVAAIYEQVTPEDVLNYGLPPYTFEVKYNGALYVISGSREQWLNFFRISRASLSIRKEAKVNID